MKRAAAICAVLAGIALVLWALFAEKSDEERIRAVLDRLEAAIRVEQAAANPVFRAARLNEQFAEIFTEDVAVHIPELSGLRSGRQALASLALRATAHLDSIDVELENVQIDVGTGLANASGEAKLDAIRKGGQREIDERRVRFRFVERGRDWKIDEVSAMPKDYADE